LLAVIAFSVINLILTALDAGIYFLFFTTIPQFVFELGRIMYFGTGAIIFMIIGLIIAFICIVPYFVFWLLAKRVRILILVALIILGIDTFVLLYFITGVEFQFSSLLDIAFRVWILYYLINGTKAWAKMSSISTDDFNVLLQEIKSGEIISSETEKTEGVEEPEETEDFGEADEHEESQEKTSNEDNNSTKE